MSLFMVMVPDGCVRESMKILRTLPYVSSFSHPGRRLWRRGSDHRRTGEKIKMLEPVIKIENLVKEFKNIKALAGVSLEVDAGRNICLSRT